MKISKILKDIELCSSFNEAEVSHITCDSRTCSEGSLFIAVRGAETDGHSYISKAIEKGALHIICEEIPDCCKDAQVQFILVKESRKACAHIASNFYGNPSEKLRVVAVTGTNGKTSIATMLYLRDFFKTNKVPVYLETALSEIGEGSVTLKDKEGNSFKVDCDSVILSVGYNPAPVMPRAKHVHVIGDAAGVGNLRTVIWGAWNVCMKL